MQKSLKYRELITDVRRVVVKIGSRVLVQKTGRPDLRRMLALAADIARIRRSGRDVVVVTSGAIGTGMEALGMKERPKLLPELQMAAAVGQCRLMSRYDDLFSRLGLKVAQILLTHDDFHHKIRLTNARRTMETLMRHEVIPIINENDAVADEEIKADLALGDNDLLASLVVKMIRADMLILLTTVDGLRESFGKGQSRRIRYVETITPKTLALVTGGASALSKGGMTTKLNAAHSVAQAGCISVIADGRQAGVLTSIMNGEDTGTLVLASGV